MAVLNSYETTFNRLMYGKMRKVIHIFSGICIVIVCVFIVKDLVGRFQTESAYDRLEEQMVSSVDGQKMQMKTKVDADTTEENAIKDGHAMGDENATEETIPEWYKESGILVNFEALQEINPDVIGWIVVEGTQISYPLLQGATNDTYLRTDYQKKSCVAGSIFLENCNKRDFSDYHMIVYGHNMRNGTMFGSLKNYRKEGFYENHPFFTVYTPEKIMRFQIFSYHETDAYGSIYKVGFEPGKIYDEYLSEIVQASYKDTGVEISSNSQVMTLSTCSSQGDRRFVVHGKCVEILEDPDLNCAVERMPCYWSGTESVMRE